MDAAPALLLARPNRSATACSRQNPPTRVPLLLVGGEDGDQGRQRCIRGQVQRRQRRGHADAVVRPQRGASGALPLAVQHLQRSLACLCSAVLCGQAASACMQAQGLHPGGCLLPRLPSGCPGSESRAAPPALPPPPCPCALQKRRRRGGQQWCRGRQGAQWESVAQSACPRLAPARPPAPCSATAGASSPPPLPGRVISTLPAPSWLHSRPRCAAQSTSQAAILQGRGRWFPGVLAAELAAPVSSTRHLCSASAQLTAPRGGRTAAPQRFLQTSARRLPAPARQWRRAGAAGAPAPGRQRPLSAAQRGGPLLLQSEARPLRRQAAALPARGAAAPAPNLAWPVSQGQTS